MQEQASHPQASHHHPASGWEKTKHAVRKVWHFLWEEDSLASWIASIIVAFLVVKFVVYPVLGWLLGTSFPIVAVVSGSMHHAGTFDDWWEGQCTDALGNPIHAPDGGVQTPGGFETGFGITKEQFREFSFRNGFNKGDLMIVASAKNADVGDVLVYVAPRLSDPVIHRIVDKRTDMNGNTVYGSGGDSQQNCRQHDFEKSITQDRVLGKAVFRIPLLGWIKIGFVAAITGFVAFLRWIGSLFTGG